MMPKASNDDLGGVESEMVDAWSRGTEATVASPYFTLIGPETRVCPLAASGWMTRPSTAAQIKSFRARPGILFETG